jgi:1,4-dihydroxy-2-naphthoyl-CoA hydrolase
VPVLHLEQRAALGKMALGTAVWVPVVKDKIQARLPGLPRFLGMQLTEATKERMTAVLVVEEAHCNGTGFIHGGALMAFGDTLGAIGAMLNLRAGQWTTTLESKTNFLAPAAEGITLTGEATPLHRGRRTQIWETAIRDETGRLIAKVTQTQMVLEKERATPAS